MVESLSFPHSSAIRSCVRFMSPLPSADRRPITDAAVATASHGSVHAVPDRLPVLPVCSSLDISAVSFAGQAARRTIACQAGAWWCHAAADRLRLVASAELRYWQWSHPAQDLLP